MFSQTPHIAVFSLAYAPFEGGAEIAAKEVIKRLEGLNFTIFTYKFDQRWLSREIVGNSEILRLGKGKNSPKKYGRVFDKIRYVVLAWREAEAMHQKKRFEAVWAIMASYGGIAALFFKMRHPSIPLFLSIQEGDSETHLRFGKFGLVGLFGTRIIRRADYIHAISRYLKEFALQRGAHAPVEVIPNGVDIPLFQTKYTPAEIKAARDNLGISDEYVVITTSRLVHKNGVDTLIDAIAEFKKKRPNVKCLIIGDGPERRSLELKVKSLKLQANILFLGQIPQRDLPLYLKISDVFVRPSRSEGLGISFLEAMAAEVPVIGTLVGGITDFLFDGQTGFAVRVDNPEAIAHKIEFIVTHPEEKKRIAHNAKTMIQEHYSWDTIARLFKNIFDKLINF